MPGVSKGRRARLKNLKQAQEEAQRQRMLQKLLKVKLERELEEEEEEAPTPHPPGDMEIGGETTLCLLCCYSFAASLRNYLAGAPVKQFLKSSDFFPDDTLTAEELLLGDTKQVSLCPECAAHLTLAVRRRDKVAEGEPTVRQLQLELLRLMTHLSVVAAAYLQSVEQLTDKINLSDEKGLVTYSLTLTSS